MCMARDKLRKTIDNSDNGLTKLLVFHACSHP